MLALFSGVVAVVGAIVLGAHCGDSWLRFGRGPGATWLDNRKTMRA